MGRVLVVDDEQGIRDALEALIGGRGHAVHTARGVDEALRWLDAQPVDLVITDLRLEPGGDGLDVLRAARRRPDPPEVIVMTAFGTRDRAQRAVADGASFYLEKGPHLATDVALLVTHAINKRRLTEDNARLRRALDERHGVEGLVGKSKAMQEVVDLVRRLAPLRSTVLLCGESGTGKERVARALHAGGAEPTAPFVPVNCGAIPANLIESELFGHVRGAFTGADVARSGLFEAAGRGTLFLDEIGELPLALQPSLLRVLQERRVKPLGAVSEVAVECRVVAATNRDLEAEVRAGRFREDLFFRLDVLRLELPPLRERAQDIPLLVASLLERFSREYGRPVSGVAPEAMQRLLAFSYPGNVRQLANILERAVALADGPLVELSQLPRDVSTAVERTPAVAAAPDAPFPEEGIDLERVVDAFERQWIERALAQAGGVKTRAAELLGLSFRQFRYKLSKYDRRGADGPPAEGS